MKTFFGTVIASAAALLMATAVSAQDINRIEEMSLNPPQDSKSLIIWQWMDGLVTKESITADLDLEGMRASRPQFRHAQLSRLVIQRSSGRSARIFNAETCLD